jgi:predicted N-acyltransferase
MAFINQLEPWGLLREFSLAPPPGFRSLTSLDGVPMFDTPFDLLTTADDTMRASLRRVPGLPRLLRWRTRFVGSTVSEYAWFPSGVDPRTMARQLRVEQGNARALLIVKDLPTHSPLLSADENAWAVAFAQACQTEGFVLMDGQALAWVPIDFADEDEYLARLSASRRKNIRRKLRSRADLNIHAVATGPALAAPALLDEMIALYENVYAQSQIHFDRLQPAYLRGLFTDADSGGTVFLYRHADRLVGWNLCYEFGGRLVDKYIGLAYPEARTHNLYAVSWMHNLAHARERGLSAYIAGWTDTEVKASLGARFTPTRHAVFARNRLLRALLRRVAGRFQAEAAS